MSNEVFNQTRFVITELELKELKKLTLSMNELLLMIYFINKKKPMLNVFEMSTIFDMREDEIVETFTSLISKNIITLSMEKNEEQKIEEIVNLDTFYNSIVNESNNKVKKNNENNVFEAFEKEFGRPLSPMELEIINGWLNDNIPLELIMGALKEATFNGVSNFRYIDKILFEWRKKGYKTMNDVSSNYIKSREERSNNQLFDYDWLDDNDK